MKPSPFSTPSPLTRIHKHIHKPARPLIKCLRLSGLALAALLLANPALAQDLYLFGGGGGAGVEAGAGGGANIGTEMGKAGDGAIGKGLVTNPGHAGTGAGTAGLNNAGNGDRSSGEGGPSYNGFGRGTADPGIGVTVGLFGGNGGSASLEDNADLTYNTMMLGGGQSGTGSQSNEDQPGGTGGAGGSASYTGANVTVNTLTITAGNSRPNNYRFDPGKGGDASTASNRVTLRGDAAVSSGNYTHNTVPAAMRLFPPTN